MGKIKDFFDKYISPVLNEKVDVGAPGKGHAKGSVKALIVAGGVVVVGGLILHKKKSKHKIEEDNNSSANTIQEGHEKAADTVNVSNASSQNKMDVDNNRTDNEIRKARAKAECELVVYGGKKDIDLDYKKRAKAAGLLNGNVIVPSCVTTRMRPEELRASFERDFLKRHRFPEVPDLLKPVFAGVPEGYEVGMLLEMMSTFGALCFSHVRAKYRDGKMTVPNIHVMVIGEAGSGKSKFGDIFNCLFEDVMAEEEAKYQINDGSKKIIQIIGPDISSAMLIDLLNVNQNTHLFIFAPEVSAMCKNLNKSEGGLSYDDLRLSIDNEKVSHWVKGGPKGLYPMYLNTMLTGTPEEVRKFIGKEVESGTAQRFCFTCIPPSGKELPMLTLPEDKDLEYIKEKISEWRQQYCFTVGACSGDDTACEDTVVDLSYLHRPLKKWLDEQWSKVEKESDEYLKKMRTDIRKRRGFIAFHCGIVLHMMWGQPKDEATRQKVVDACLFIAEYITESYLLNVSLMERGFDRTAPIETQGNNGRRKWKEEEIAEMAALHRQFNEKGQPIYGWDTLAAMYKTSFATVSRKVKEYEKNHGNDND